MDGELNVTRRADAADVAIVGGGPVGQCLALALRDIVQRPLSVIEPQKEAPEDKRTLALSESSRRYLERLGVWRAMASRARPIRHIQISEKGAFGKLCIHSDEENLPSLGWVVPFSLLHRVLRDEIEKSAHVRYASTTASRVVSRNGLGRVTLDGDFADVCARVVAVTSNRAEALLRDANIRRVGGAYGQSAVIASMRTEREIGDTAYERFTPHGPLAVIPGADNDCAVVWVRDDAQAQAIRDSAPQECLNRLRDDFGYRLGRILSVEVLAVYPLSASCLSARSHGCVATLGAGANVVHPVAAQGFNLGLRDVETLADKLRGLATMSDAQLADALAEWGRERAADASAIIRFTDLLARGFLERWKVFTPLRRASMLSLSLLPAWRRAILRRYLRLGASGASHARAPQSWIFT